MAPPLRQAGSKRIDRKLAAQYKYRFSSLNLQNEVSFAFRVLLKFFKQGGNDEQTGNHYYRFHVYHDEGGRPFGAFI